MYWKETTKGCFINGEYYHLGYESDFSENFYYKGVFEFHNGFLDNGYPITFSHYIHIPRPQDLWLTTSKISG